MPELPDLEVIAEFLQRELAGVRIEGASILKPIVVRNLTGDDLTAGLVGQCIQTVSRRGEFLLLPLSSGDWLVINPMLAGRLRYHPANEKAGGKPFLVLRLANGMSLRYSDAAMMGKVYLTWSLELVPGFAGQGPEALDPQLTLDAFAARLRRHHGEIKGILTNQSFVAGIGNAYADEILFCARVYPFRKRPSLSEDEARRIYECMHTVLEEAVETLRQRLTNFCRTCQPGTIIR